MQNCRFSHIALLVTDAELSAKYLKNLGFLCNPFEVFPTEGTKEIYVGSYDENSGLLLLVEGISEGPYQRALAKRGPSLHHIAIDVLDMAEYLLHAQQIGWCLHSICSETLKHSIAWMYKPGIPTLIEVNRKDSIPTQPFKVTKIVMNITVNQCQALHAIGLNCISCGTAPSIEMDGIYLNISDILSDVPSCDGS